MLEIFRRKWFYQERLTHWTRWAFGFSVCYKGSCGWDYYNDLEISFGPFTWYFLGEDR